MPDIYIRIISLHNGKMISKKKTASTKLVPNSSSFFDESIAFDIPTEQICSLSFIVVVIATPKISNNDEEIIADNTTLERYVGKVPLGPKARSTGFQHFELSFRRPREQIVLWHVLR